MAIVVVFVIKLTILIRISLVAITDDSSAIIVDSFIKLWLLLA